MEGEKMKMSCANCQVKFVAWKKPPKKWASWVQNLSSVLQSTWKNAGIYEAIMSSTYPITRHDDLVVELASRWCTDTNTFVFPWGEATLTLEDMLVLGGFSPLGVSVLSSLENDAKLVKIEERLERKRMELVRSRAQSALQGRWLEKFKDCGSDLEHAAFLSLWLSRFVFPMGPKSLINKLVFPVAARLSRGIKVALGPVVLAKLYRDLTSLTRRQRFTQLIYESGDSVGQVDLCALFHLVQIWAWERFPMLKPVPNRAYSAESFPRSARRSNVKISKDSDLKSALDSADKAFLWCPYASSANPEGRDPESFGRCIKTSELVGFDSCIVSYQPQRVLKQFGLDQDILSDNVDKFTGLNTSDDVKPTMNDFKEKLQKKQTYPKSSQVKVENAVYCGPPGLPARIEVIDLVDSDSDFDVDFDVDFDEDYSLMVTEPTKLYVPEAGSGRLFPFSVASPDVAIDDTCFVEKTAESETAEKQQTPPLTSAQIKREDDQDFVPCGFASQAKLVTVDFSVQDDDKNDGGEVQLQRSNLASPHSLHESNEAVDFVSGSVHELGEEKGEVAETKHDEIEGRSTGYLQNEFAMSCYAESYTNENSKDFDFDFYFDLEARISRLEDIVYARRKALEADK